MARRVLCLADTRQSPTPAPSRGTPASYVDCRLRGVLSADSVGIGISFDRIGGHPGSEVRIHLSLSDALTMARLVVDAERSLLAARLDVALQLETAHRLIAQEAMEAARATTIRRSRKAAAAKSPKRKAVRR